MGRSGFKRSIFPAEWAFLVAPVVVLAIPVAQDGGHTLFEEAQELHDRVIASEVAGTVTENSDLNKEFLPSVVARVPAPTGTSAVDEPDSDSDSESDGVSSISEDSLDAPGGENKPLSPLPPSTSISTPQPGTTIPPRATSNSSAIPALQGGQPTHVARHFMIAGVSIGGTVILALIIFAIYRWRKQKQIIPAPFFKKRRHNPPPLDDSGPITGVIHNYNRISHSMTEQYPPSTLFGGGSSNQTAHIRRSSIPGMPFPAPALAPSNGSIARRESRMLLVRKNLQTFHEEEDPESPVDGSPPPRYATAAAERRASRLSRRVSDRFPIATVENVEGSVRDSSYNPFPPPPPIPQSPDHNPPLNSRFSWTTNPDAAAPSVRTSISSEPRFRPVSEWVQHQASRHERLGGIDGPKVPPVPAVPAAVAYGATAGELPATPAAFRHHPGAPVSFNTHHARIESSDLDRLVGQTRVVIT